MNREGVLGSDSGGGPGDRDPSVDADERELEPEVVRWLSMYADAVDDRGDATVAAIFDEVNRLLRRYREADSVHRADYGLRLRALSEHLPVVVWTTGTDLQVASFAGGGLAHVEIQPSSGVSLPLAELLGTGRPARR